MRKYILLPFVLLLATTMYGLSQTPIPDPDTVGNPIQQGDPAIEMMPPGLDYVEDKKRITPDEFLTLYDRHLIVAPDITIGKRP